VPSFGNRSRSEELGHSIERAPPRVQRPNETDDLSTLVESTNVRPLKRTLALVTPMDPVSESEDARQVFEDQPPAIRTGRERMDPESSEANRPPASSDRLMTIT
jgi:hypothetical protein